MAAQSKRPDRQNLLAGKPDAPGRAGSAARKNASAKSGAKKPAKDNLLLVGRFGAPQGVQGEVRIRSFTADPMAVATYGPLSDAKGTQFYRVLEARPAKNDTVIARIEGVTSRTEAEKLTNRDLYIPRHRLPEPEEEEFYYADLIGLEARGPNGNHFGRVINLENFGAGDILEIRLPEGDTHLIPFTKLNVPVIDKEAGFLIVIPPQEVDVPHNPD